jgi:hypothetical protein
MIRLPLVQTPDKYEIDSVAVDASATLQASAKKMEGPTFTTLTFNKLRQTNSNCAIIDGIFDIFDKDLTGVHVGRLNYIS